MPMPRPPLTDGCAAVVLAAGDKAYEWCERPAFITGIDHRIETHALGARDLTVSPSTKLAGLTTVATSPAVAGETALAADSAKQPFAEELTRHQPSPQHDQLRVNDQLEHLDRPTDQRVGIVDDVQAINVSLLGGINDGLRCDCGRARRRCPQESATLGGEQFRPQGPDSRAGRI